MLLFTGLFLIKDNFSSFTVVGCQGQLLFKLCFYFVYVYYLIIPILYSLTFWYLVLLLCLPRPELHLFIFVLICSMMLLVEWLQGLKRNVMKLGHCLHRQKGSSQFRQMPYQQMSLAWAMGKEVFLFIILQFFCFLFITVLQIIF